MAKAEVGRAMASCCLSFLGFSTSPPKQAKEQKGQSLHEFLLQFLGSVEGDLALSHCEPVALQRLACCSKMLHETIGREHLVKKRAEDWALDMQCSQLEHLAFNMAMRELLDGRKEQFNCIISPHKAIFFLDLVQLIFDYIIEYTLLKFQGEREPVCRKNPCNCDSRLCALPNSHHVLFGRSASWVAFEGQNFIEFCKMLIPASNSWLRL